jgi:RimJ/RimL family protein N-acetyltransferase
VQVHPKTADYHEYNSRLMADYGTPRESAAALDAAVDAALRSLARVDETSSLEPLRPGGWCARETLGHLIDSACNNHRRFVIGQPPGVERFDGYTQDEWVSLQQHRDRSWESLIELWTAYNRHLAHVMRSTTAEAAEGSAIAPDGSGPITVGYLMDDYVRHLQHHVGQIHEWAARRPRSWPTGGPVDMTPAPAPERRTLSGIRHNFEPIDPGRHVQDLFAGSHTPEAEGMWTYLWYGPFASAEVMRAWLDTCASTSDPLFYAVLERATGRAVGMCSLLRIVPEMKTLELGHIWYAPAVQGTGVNADMALTLLTACFEQWGYRRAEWKCDALNGRSRAAALKLGFTFEGVFRQHMVRKGRNRDTAWFAMLDSDWPSAKPRLERMASP